MGGDPRNQEVAPTVLRYGVQGVSGVDNGRLNVQRRI